MEGESFVTETEEYDGVLSLFVFGWEQTQGSRKVLNFRHIFILYPLPVTTNQTKKELCFPVFTFRAIKLNCKFNELAILLK